MSSMSEPTCRAEIEILVIVYRKKERNCQERNVARLDEVIKLLNNKKNYIEHSFFIVFFFSLKDLWDTSM